MATYNDERHKNYSPPTSAMGRKLPLKTERIQQLTLVQQGRKCSQTLVNTPGNFERQMLPTRQSTDQIATRWFDIALVELPLSKASVSIEHLDASSDLCCRSDRV